MRCQRFNEATTEQMQREPLNRVKRDREVQASPKRTILLIDSQSTIVGVTHRRVVASRKRQSRHFFHFSAAARDRNNAEKEVRALLETEGLHTVASITP